MSHCANSSDFWFMLSIEKYTAKEIDKVWVYTRGFIVEFKLEFFT